MIHFSDASPTNRTVMGAQRLDAQATRTPVNHLARVRGHLLDVLGRGVAQRHRARIVQHRRQVRGDGEKGERLKYARVDEAADGERHGQHDDEHDDELGEHDERPGHDGAHDATCVLHAPHAVRYGPGTVAAGTRAAVLVVVVAGATVDGSNGASVKPVTLVLLLLVLVLLISVIVVVVVAVIHQTLVAVRVVVSASLVGLFGPRLVQFKAAKFVLIPFHFQLHIFK
mgnify:CR=1 FL=1